jgi:hypothetical protein
MNIDQHGQTANIWLRTQFTTIGELEAGLNALRKMYEEFYFSTDDGLEKLCLQAHQFSINHFLLMLQSLKLNTEKAPAASEGLRKKHTYIISRKRPVGKGE